MKLRWFIKKTSWKQWDDRSDKWYPASTQSTPILQMKVDGKWTDVPTHTLEKALNETTGD